MSAKVTVPLAAKRGRTRDVGTAVAPEAPDAPVSPPPERVPRVARVLALAHHWQGLIRSGAVRDQAEIARLVGVSRARVTQVMRLLHLAPDIQEQILLDSDSCHRQTGGAHRSLLRIASEPTWQAQRALRSSAHLRPVQSPALTAD